MRNHRTGRKSGEGHSSGAVICAAENPAMPAFAGKRLEGTRRTSD